jgi:hypothetical protein
VHAGTGDGGEIVGRSSGGGELSSVEGAGEMISDGSSGGGELSSVEGAGEMISDGSAGAKSEVLVKCA